MAHLTIRLKKILPSEKNMPMLRKATYGEDKKGSLAADGPNMSEALKVPSKP